ncbi:hypothetical protein VTJ04DRAFT_9434 [Mycothermus thermophilus]|uniref:uncharacterized protein n=1 Tax=Humicola insolens TaxID=85995 RepID=UPI00374256F5
MSLPSSPAGGGQPLQPVSHNAQRDSIFSSPQIQRSLANVCVSPSRDSTVHEKIHQFNALALQSKQSERAAQDVAQKDAALKRATLAREQAEAEMRRYRDEARMLRKELEASQAEKNRVSQRLDEVMEHVAGVKEQAHNEVTAYQKEVRRKQKEIFKTQREVDRVVAELQSSLKARRELEAKLEAEQAKNAALQQEFEAKLEAEQAKYAALEQELEKARLETIAIQEHLQSANMRVATLENDLAAAKMETAKMDAVNSAQIDRHQSEFDSYDWEGPRKRPRLSEPTSTENDIDVEALYEWEKQRADRAVAQIEFLQAECQLNMCAAAKKHRQKSSSNRSSQRKRPSMLISDAGDSMILREGRQPSCEPGASADPTPRQSKTERLKGARPRCSNIYIPADSTNRTLSQTEASAMAAIPPSPVDPVPTGSLPPVTPTESDPHYRRTPSVEPPDFAVPPKDRTSLMSLLDAPVRQDPEPVFNIPTMPAAVVEARQGQETASSVSRLPQSLTAADDEDVTPMHPPRCSSAASFATNHTDPEADGLSSASIRIPYPRPHTTASFYPSTADTASASSRSSSSTTTTATVASSATTLSGSTTIKTTTTKVPLKDEPQDGPTLAQRLLKMQRTPSRPTSRISGDSNEDGASEVIDLDKPTFDPNNPAMTPTISREEMLERIRERRVRAKSVAAPAGTRTGSSSSTTTTTNTSGRTSAASNHGHHDLKRKVSGGSATSGTTASELRRKASQGDLARGRDREARGTSATTRGVSTARPGAAAAGAAARRVRT